MIRQGIVVEPDERVRCASCGYGARIVDKNTRQLTVVGILFKHELIAKAIHNALMR